MRLSALIFDMDGTMIDSMPTHRRTWAEFAAMKGLAVDIDDLMRRITGRNGVECMRELFQAEIPEVQAIAYNAEKEALYRQLFGPMFAEVAGFSAFAELAHTMGLAIGVGTAGDRHNVDFAYRHLRMAHTPSVTVRGDEGLPGKPDPAIFLEAARRLGVLPAQCVVFEDAPLGIEAARRAGMQAVGIGSSHSARELAGPHVLAYAPNFSALIESKFLEKTYVATT